MVASLGCKAHKKQPETAQRVDLMLRYVDVDRTESNSTSSCPREERNHNREAQNLQLFTFLRVLRVRNSQKKHRKLT
jgi:hypothetical protein